MSAQLRPLNRLYDETYDLLVEARNYFAYAPSARKAVQQSDAHTCLFIQFQALRLTSRMTQAMAWLLAWRAVQSGEISAEQASDGRFALGEESICTEGHAHDLRIPANMQHLLERSHHLYLRVLRLDRASRQLPTSH